jgi:hypothetical protein
VARWAGGKGEECGGARRASGRGEECGGRDMSREEKGHGAQAAGRLDWRMGINERDGF